MTKYLLYQNKKIFYRIAGSGKPVLFIHGFGEDGEVWNNQLGLISSNPFQFIIPDLPGSGKSELIDNMSMEGMADVILSIIRQENITHLTIIGHSMGGYILLAFAEKYPKYLNAFGLYHSTAYADSEEKKAARRKGIDFINEHSAFEFLKTSTLNLFSPKTKDTKAQLVNEFIESLSNFSSAALVSYYHAMIYRPDRTIILKEAKIPILFIMGEYDNAIPLNDCLQQCHLPEKSYIHILFQSGHMGMLEETEKANRALKDFLLEV